MNSKSAGTGTRAVGSIGVDELPPVRGRSVHRSQRAPSMLQHVAVMLDGSSSMASSRFKVAHTVLHDMLTILGEDGNLGAFRVSIVLFSSSAQTLVESRPCNDIDRSTIPSEAPGGGTNIALALDKALELVNRPRTEAVPFARPLGIVLTDGEHNGPNSLEAAATRFKAQADLVAAGIGEASLAQLAQIATSPAHAVIANSAEDLRRFFQRLAKSMSASARAGMPAGTNIANALLRG